MKFKVHKYSSFIPDGLYPMLIHKIIVSGRYLLMEMFCEVDEFDWIQIVHVEPIDWREQSGFQLLLNAAEFNLEPGEEFDIEDLKGVTVTVEVLNKSLDGLQYLELTYFENLEEQDDDDTFESDEIEAEEESEFLQSCQSEDDGECDLQDSHELDHSVDNPNLLSAEELSKYRRIPFYSGSKNTVVKRRSQSSAKLKARRKALETDGELDG